MGSQEENSSSVKNCVNITSGALMDVYSFKWKIENFEMVKVDPDLFKQQFFYFEVGDKGDTVSTKWKCYLQKCDNKCGIFFELEKITCQGPAPQVNQVCVSFEIRMIRRNGRIYKIHKVYFKSMTVGMGGWGFPGFFSKENDATLKTLIWEDGSLVIEGDFKVFLNKPASLDLNEQVKIFERKAMQNFVNAISRTMEDTNKTEDLGKVKVVTRDKVEFLASPAILSARSPVFKAMFMSGNWKESQKSAGGEGGGGEEASLVLDDMLGKSMKVLLNYLYGGGLLTGDWMAEDVILELTWAAGKYQLEELAEFLDMVLVEVPLKDLEVVGKLALLAKRLGMKTAEKGLFARLKKEAVDIEQLVLDKEDSILEEPTRMMNKEE